MASVTPKTYSSVKVPEGSTVNGNQGASGKVADDASSSLFPQKRNYLLMTRWYPEKVKFPRGKVTPRRELPQIRTGKVEQGIINLDAYLRSASLEDIRLYSPIKFPGHPMKNILEKMFLEVRERFMDPDFVLKHLRDITSEFEYFRQVGLRKDLPRFLRTLARIYPLRRRGQENLPVEEIPTGFISSADFRKIVGKSCSSRYILYRIESR